MSHTVIGIDVGGTNIVAAVVSGGGPPVASKKGKTPQGLSFAEAVPKFKEMAEKAMAKAGVGWDGIAAVGLAVPSSIDPRTGILRHAPNLGWQNEQALAPCREIFAKPVALGNDVSFGLYAEHLFGSAKGTSSVAGFFVGTGLGGGLVLNGDLVEGPHGLAGEFGHMVVKQGGRTCGCGKEGCIEA
jgi:glucokinase